MRYHAPYMPTAEEIRQATRDIQRGWTDEEERRHRVGGDPGPLRFDPVPDNVFGPAVWSEART